MDLFTESESSQDTEAMVCDLLLFTAHLINDLGYTSCDFHIYDQATAAEKLTFWMPQFETLDPEETFDTGHLFKADTDSFTLAGLDDDWETTDLQPASTQRQRSFFDGDVLGCITLDLGAPLTGFPWYASTCSDVPLFYECGAVTLDQPVLDLDLDEEGTTEEEVVLEF